MQWYFFVRLEHFVAITPAFNLSSHHTTPLSFVVPAQTLWKRADTAKCQLLSLKLTGCPSSTTLRQSWCRTWIISFPSRQPLQGRELFMQPTGWAASSLKGMSRAMKAPPLPGPGHTQWGNCRFQLHSSQTRQLWRSNQDQTWQHPRAQCLLWHFQCPVDASRSKLRMSCQRHNSQYKLLPQVVQTLCNLAVKSQKT